MLYSCVSLTGSYSWLIAFLAQLNPLFGPEVKNALAAHMRRAWLGFEASDNSKYPCKTIGHVFVHVFTAHVPAQVFQTGDATAYVNSFCVCELSKSFIAMCCSIACTSQSTQNIQGKKITFAQMSFHAKPLSWVNVWQEESNIKCMYWSGQERCHELHDLLLLLGEGERETDLDHERLRDLL